MLQRISTESGLVHVHEEHHAGSDVTLGACVRRSLNQYFSKLAGQPPAELYDLVVSEVEKPLLEVVLGETRGNLSKAALILGINRGTLRKKLKRHGFREG